MPPALSSREDHDLVRRYNAGVDVVTTAIASLSESQWDQRLDDGWSARMVIHHLADSETNSYLRLRRLVAEPAPTVIQGYDEELWSQCAALGYATLPVEPSLEVFRAVRVASSQILSRLNDADLDRAGVHTQSGPYTLRDWLTIYAAHAEDHALQITRAARVRPPG